MPGLRKTAQPVLVRQHLLGDGMTAFDMWLEEEEKQREADRDPYRRAYRNSLCCDECGAAMGCNYWEVERLKEMWRRSG